MRLLALALAVLPGLGLGQEKAQTRELVGQLGNRSALLVLHSAERADGGWRMSGEYLILETLVRRFVEGERSPQIGVTTLKEGTSAILFGRPATGELRGTYRGGVFKGTRFGPGGQERERFEFTEEFPSMDAYSATVRCEVADARYGATLAYAVEAGRLKSMEWASRVAPSGHACSLSGLQQQPAKGALKLASGDCTVTFRDLGDHVKVAAEGCTAACGSGAYLEPMLVDRGGRCRLLRPEAR
jgi:hypothetical protein